MDGKLGMPDLNKMMMMMMMMMIELTRQVCGGLHSHWRQSMESPGMGHWGTCPLYFQQFQFQFTASYPSIV